MTDRLTTRTLHAHKHCLPFGAEVDKCQPGCTQLCQRSGCSEGAAAFQSSQHCVRCAAQGVQAGGTGVEASKYSSLALGPTYLLLNDSLKVFDSQLKQAHPSQAVHQAYQVATGRSSMAAAGFMLSRFRLDHYW